MKHQPLALLAILSTTAAANAQAVVAPLDLTNLSQVAVENVPAAEAEGSWDDFRDDWHYRSNLGLWLASIEGTVGGSPRRSPSGREFESDVDISFEDLFDKTNLAIGTNFELGYGPFTVLFNGQWQQFEDDVSTFRGFDGDLEAQFAWADLGISYLLIDERFDGGTDTNRLTIEGIVGVRWVYLSVDAKINEGPLAGAEEDREKNWFDPYVGARARYTITRNWIVSGSAGIGGFGVGSDLVWQAAAGVEYRISRTVGVFAGYRAVSFDYEDDGFTFDTVLHGPEVGISFRW